MEPYRIPEQNCNKCVINDECEGLDYSAKEITRQYKTAQDVIMVSVINCDRFEKA